MTKGVAVVGSVVALTTLGTWIGFVLGQRSVRYETKVAGEGLYKIDRQTGVVEFCHGVRCGVANSSQNANAGQAGPSKRGNADQEFWKRNLENQQRFHFLMLLEEGFVSSDGKWTDKARRAYQAETKPGTIGRAAWGVSVPEKIRDRRLAALGANPSSVNMLDLLRSSTLLEGQ